MYIYIYKTRIEQAARQICVRGAGPEPGSESCIVWAYHQCVGSTLKQKNGAGFLEKTIKYLNADPEF